MKRLLGTALLLATFSSTHAAEYVIDGSGAGMHTAVNFRASHLGISALWGRFNDITGSFSYDAADVSAAKITVDIDPASIDTNHAERDIHLRSGDYLDVARFPSAGFVSSAVHDLGNDKIHVTGDLTLHGVTKEISFEAIRTGEGQTPFGDYRVGFEAEATIDMAEFGIGVGPLTFLLAIEGIRR